MTRPIRFSLLARSWTILPVALFFALSLAASLPIGAYQSRSPGETIYAKRCVRCHGAKGEGTSRNKKPLIGERSVAQLAELIRKTMPLTAPGTLKANEAREVATYLHGAFYSPIARARNAPARIELTRLTVGQLRLALSDLVGGFRGPVRWGDQRGLTGDYFNGRRIGGRFGRAATRLDPQIRFDFGPEVPLKELTEPRAFSIRWSGSLLAPDTGDYEFIVRTGQAVRFWLNDLQQPLIDAWVRSGNDTEQRARTFLVGGRVYPLRLEYSKANQGVDDTEKQKDKPPAPASMTLCWQRPQGAVEPIPARNLCPDENSGVFVCATPFPPDDRSYGWERATSISRAWEEATTSAAFEVAGHVVANLNQLAGTSDTAPDRMEQLKQFCHRFVERAFRRPLTDEQREFFVHRQFAATSEVEAAVKRVILLTLKSPRFLMREVGDEPSPYDVAERLAFGLWDSLPDRELLDAAREGRLRTREQIAQQAERMLGDLRARAKLHRFLLLWVRAESESELSKDPQKFPGFSAATVADLRTSLELFLDEVVWSGESDFRNLLLADTVLLNNQLAKFFGVEAAAEDYVKVRLDGGQRAGILTHPYLMMRFADRSESSPIHRGVFLARGVLGQSLRPPPEAVTLFAPELHPGLTTRERVALQTRSAACMSCHELINPLGFTLERFDAIGRYREQDRGKPIDDQGSYRRRDGKVVSLRGARELAEFLAGSPEAHDAFVEQLFHHLVQQPMQAYGRTTREELRRTFTSQGFSIRKLAVEVMATSAHVGRETVATATNKSSTRIGGS